MGRAFEELAAQELDGLYQGALFLSGGNARGAETLLIEAVTLAYEEHPYESEIASVERWLEARLVRAFLKRVSGGPAPLPIDLERRVDLAEGTFESLGATELFAAARAVPPWPRAALWLVMLRRGSYADVASAMGLQLGAVPELLRYRDVLMKEIIGRERSRNGSTGRVS